jgi:hypothetical protein
MIHHAANSMPSPFTRWLVLLLTFCGFAVAQASDIKLDVCLIWGANEPKSPNPAHKPLEDELAKKLSKVFKWKHYFEVKRVQETVPNRSTKRIKLSPKCEIEITEMAGTKVEVKLFGEGKPINTTTKNLDKGEYFVLAGDDKNECAWFILIKQIE